MTIDVAFFGVLGKDPERKISQAGRSYLRANERAGSGDAAQWISLMIFNNVDELADRLKKDSKVYVEGGLTADAWTNREGKVRPSLTVMTWHCSETHRIGRNKAKRERKGGGEQ